MSVATNAEVAIPLGKAQAELAALARTIDDEIESVARTFEGLAGYTDTILNSAAAIVACVENESVSSVLPKVRTLGAAAQGFIGERLQATTGILETVTKEVEPLRQLSRLTHGQGAISVQTSALRVLTNIEVGRLGEVGEGFHYLAHELADFSKAVTADVRLLDSQIGGRRAAIDETRKVLSAELPRLRERLEHIEADLGSALAEVESGLNQLSSAPVQFRTGVQEIAQQIAGVVAAVQAHDITRQQIEHVQEAFALISSKMCDENADQEAVEELPQFYAGLTIQIYQLKTIKETVANWASQIGTCMAGILRVSASEVVGIGPMVLEQERKVASQLSRIESLERESQEYSQKIQATFGGLANLMQLFSEHLQRSKAVRDRLRLLSFNSIIESSHLGTQAAAMLSIAKGINGISNEWSQITDKSEESMQEILALVQETNKLMEAFSDSSSQKLREAQEQTMTGLENLRSAAEFAATRAQEMKRATEEMQARIGRVGAPEICSAVVLDAST